AVAQNDPDDPYGESMLGWLAYLGGQHETALTHYRRAEELEPWNSKNQLQIALASGALGRRQDSIAAYRRVLQIDPDQVEACWRLSLALCDSDLPEEALPLARHAVQLTQHQSIDALMSLAIAQLETGKQAEAAETIRDASSLAATKAP